MSGQRTPPSNPPYNPPSAAEQELTRLVTELLRRAGDPFNRQELGPEARHASMEYDRIRRTLDHDNPPRVDHPRHHADDDDPERLARRASSGFEQSAI